MQSRSRLWRPIGQDLVEYSLILSLLVVAIIVGLATVNESVSQVFNQVGGWIAASGLE